MDFPGRRLIEAMARVVPAPRRREWMREWEAEVAYTWRRMNEVGSSGRWTRARLRLRVWSCVVDALWERKETMTMTGLMNDLRQAVRGLLRKKSFTVVVILTLALGIGANTAVFTLVDAVLIQPLPYPDGERLVSLRHLGRDGRDALPMSDGLYQLYRAEATTLEAVALYRGTSVNLVLDGEARRVAAQAVTPGFFGVLGTEAALGRAFTEGEGMPDGEPAVILSDGFWRTHLGGDPDVLGRTLDINGRLRPIVGVMPAGFGFPEPEAQLWLPYVVDPARAPLAAFGAGSVGRFVPGASTAGVQGELQSFIDRLPEFFPESGAVSFLREVGLRATVAPMKETLVGDVRQTLWVLLGTVGLVLLIACANVANLLLVRAEGRQRELALRIAVGAGRRRILRWFLSESAVLVGVGAALGIGIAAFSVSAALDFVPADIPRLAEVGIDLRALAFTGVIGFGCVVFFGVFPLVRFGVSDLSGQLKDGGGRGSTGGPERHTLRNGLVVAQMALALVLLIGSGLMFRSFQALRDVDPGFRPEGVVTARIDVPSAEMNDWVERDGFFRELRTRLAAQPGILSVGMSDQVPLVSGGSYFSVDVEDHPRGPEELPVFASNSFTRPGLVDALGLRLLEGRALEEGDDATGTRSVMVNRTFAQQWWPDSSPIGRRVRFGFDEEEWYTIVGVIEDTRSASLAEPPVEGIYWPSVTATPDGFNAVGSLQVVIRTAGDPAQAIPVLRSIVRDLNARIPVSNPVTMEEALGHATSRTSFTLVLLGIASGIALVLGLVGIYGVISYVVSQRTREIGVRMALGASEGVVRAMVVRQGLVLAGIGALLGLGAAAGLSRVMGSLIYGVSSTDPVTYVVLAGALIGTAVLASWIPAARASAVNPSRALRSE